MEYKKSVCLNTLMLWETKDKNQEVLMNGLNFGCAEGRENNCSCMILLLLLLCGGCGNLGCNDKPCGCGCDICTILVILILLGAI